MPGGRPTIYSKELADEICCKIATGMSLNSICKLEDMPCLKTVLTWVDKKKEFLHKYERAKEQSADYLFEEMRDIADNEAGKQAYDKDGNKMLDAEGNPLMVYDSASVAHAKLRVETRKWHASKLKPKKYGDKSEQVISGGDNPVKTDNKWTIEVVSAENKDT